MNNVMPYGRRDEVSGVEGDTLFVGVDERMPQQAVQPGYVCSAQNVRFRNGRAATREGIGLLPWMPVDGVTPFEEAYGAGVFSDPSPTGLQWILMAAKLNGTAGIWRTRPNYVASPVPLVTDAPLTQGTFRKFLQAAGAVLLLRGLDTDVLQCTDLDEGFRPIGMVNSWTVTFEHATNRVGLPEHNLLIGDPVRFTAGTGQALPAAIVANKTYYVLEATDADHFTIAATPGGTRVTWNLSDTDAAIDVATVTVLDGASPIPPASDGIFILNRVLLITGKDTAVVSDIGDFTRYQPVQSAFRINQGDSDTLVSLALFNEDTVVFFKSGRVLKVTGVSGDLSQAQGPLNVTEAYGGLGPGATVAHGTDIYWLSSERRVANLQLTQLNQEQGTNLALSDTLVQTFGRINGTYAAVARLAVHDGFLFCALPLDDARLVDETELVPAALSYTDGVTAVVVSGLTPGRRYQFRQGAFDGNLVNGSETLPGDADFTAQGTSVSLFLYSAFAGPQAVGTSLRWVRAEGVNTAVAVYDFQNGAWAGSDGTLTTGEGLTIAVKDWLKFQHGGRERLGFLGADGWLHLYAEGFEDESLQTVPAPYVDVLADRLSLLAPGDTLQVNGGTVVTAEAQPFNTVSGPTKWGISGAAGANLWTDANGVGGFEATAIAAWSAPNCVATQIDSGVRFTATNGVLPQVKINGVAAVNGFSDWALLDSHSANEIGALPVVNRVLTRGYRCNRADMKRYLQLAAQLATWSPRYTFRSLTQGVGSQETQVDAETRNRLKYFSPWEGNDWDPTNKGDDYLAPRREDYSFEATDAGLLLGSGVDLDALQEYVHRTPVNERGLWMQLEVVNEDGRLEMLATAMEAEGAEVLSGPAIG